MSYGIPYKGNKSKIARDIIGVLPSGERLVDLFGGGGSIIDCAVREYNDKYNQFLYNDYNKLLVDLFRKAVQGKYNHKFFKPRWISRSEFHKQKGVDGYVKYIWSFGNNGKDYLFNRDFELFKEQAHNYIVFGDTKGLEYLEKHYHNSYYWHIKDLYVPDDYILSRKYYVNMIMKIEAIRVCVDYGDKNVYNTYKDYSFDEFYELSSKELCRCIDEYCPMIPKKNYKTNKKELSELQQLQQLQHLERLEQLQRLQELENLERLEQLQQLQQLEQLQRLQHLEQSKLQISCMNYLNYEYQEGDIVYCDIPYQNTNCGSYNRFNHHKFYRWIKKQDYPIYVSEYSTARQPLNPELVWSKELGRTFNTRGRARVEALYRFN